MKNLLKALFLSLIISISSTFAGEWHEIFEPPTINGVITAMASREFDFNQIFAVGANGNVYRSFNGGNQWEIRTNFPEALTDLVIFNFSENNRILVVGENGFMANSDDMGNSWFGLINPISGDITSIIYSEYNQSLWAATADGELWSSTDYGATWFLYIDSSAGLMIVDMITGPAFSNFVLSVKNDTSFIHEIDTTVYYSRGDTLPNITLKSLVYRNHPSEPGILYMAGNEISAGDAVVYRRDFEDGPGIPFLSHRLAAVDFTGISLFSIFDTEGIGSPVDLLWVTTNRGAILQSDNLGLSWRQVYQHPSNDPITSIISNRSNYYEFGQGLAMGTSFGLKYSFEMQFINPNKGDQYSHSINQIEMRFSGVPELSSIENSIHVTSNLSGTLNYYSEYDRFDSSFVRLLINRDAPQGSIPGEQWNIALVDTIRQLHSDGLPPSIHPFSITADFLPHSSGTMDYVADTEIDTIQNTTTNFVTGFFNQDDILDIITFDGLALHIIETDGFGRFINDIQIPLPYETVIDGSIKDQLCTTDFNNDGRLDLIYYDNGSVYGIINNSLGLAFNFTAGTAYSTPNILDVKVVDANQNRQPDLIILTMDSLLLREDIDETMFGMYSYVVEFVNPGLEFFRAGDIDLDGKTDIIAYASSQQIYFYRGSPFGGFEPPRVFATSNVYNDLKLADLDVDKRLDVIGIADNVIGLHEIDFNGDLIPVFIPALTQPIVGFIEDVIIQDFGGMDYNQNRLMDIAIVTSDSLKFIENSSSLENYSFTKRSDKSLYLGRSYNRALFWDGNRNAKLDILAYNVATGNFQNNINDSWSSQITNIVIENDGVHISWRRFPDGLGEFSYYRLYRQSADFQNHDYRDFTINTIDDTNFIDIETRPFERYNYSLEIVYNETNSLTSQAEFIELINYVTGPLTGVLEDSVRGYYVRDSVTVPAGDSLTINSGVEFAFDQYAVFNVYGGLNVLGTPEGMIEFGINRRDSTEEFTEPWQGFHLFPGTDTVRFEWFSVFGANIGIFADHRPLKIFLGGIVKNNIGIMADGGTLIASNILVDSNFIGISIEETSTGFLRNITAIGNGTGIVVDPNGTAIIKNSIIWNNETTDIDLLAGCEAYVKYSTVQQINGSGEFYQVNSSIMPIYINSEDLPYMIQQGSPTIDAGDPTDDYSMEPEPNGGRINQGLFGGTFFATPSLRDNTAPLLASFPTVTATTGQLYSYQIETVDAENDSVTVNEVSLPEWLMFDGSRNISGIASSENVGIDTISFVLRDAFNGESRYSFNIEVVETNLTPIAEMENGDLSFNLPVDQIIIDSLKIRNTGDGTLLIRLTYTPNVLNNVWFTMDTTVKTIAANDSAFVRFRLHPNKNMVRGTRNVNVHVQSNSAIDNNLDFRITMNPVFDDFAPNIVVAARSEVIVKQSAFSIHFFGDDRTDRPIGVDIDSLFYYYRLLNSQDSLIESGDSLIVNSLNFFPLENGSYRLVLWASDTRGNVKLDINKDIIRFEINATQVNIAKTRWYMISIPRPIDVTWNNFVAKSGAQIYRWDASNEKYTAIHTKLDSTHNMGEAVWIVSGDRLPLDISTYQQAEVGDVLTTPIEEGWNQVGIPVSYSTAWKDMSFTPFNGNEMSLFEAAGLNLVEGIVYSYGNQGYEGQLIDSDANVGIAVPWFGYFLKANVPGILKYSTSFYDILANQALVTPTETGNELAKSVGYQTEKYYDSNLNIRLSSSAYEDNLNIFGIDNSGLINDATEPPHIGSYNAMYFVDNGKMLTRKMVKEFSSLDEVKQWDFIIESHNANISHTLNWNPEEISATGYYFFLLDEKKETVVNMNMIDNYTFKPGDFKTGYKVYASQDASFKPDIIPVVYRLKQNYPNPFNPSTTVSFGVPVLDAGEKIKISIYNVLGQEIFELVNNSYNEGYHEVVWYGQNSAGQKVASGVYFYKLKAGTKTLIQKMVLIR